MTTAAEADWFWTPTSSKLFDCGVWRVDIARFLQTVYPQRLHTAWPDHRQFPGLHGTFRRHAHRRGKAFETFLQHAASNHVQYYI